MKSPLLFLALAVLAACQSHPAPVATAGAAPAAAAAPPVAAVPDSTAAVRALLRQVNLAPAWQGSPQYAMEGFYGPDNYRISFHLDSVWQDAARPGVFQFRGHDRFKKTITSFTGTLTVTRLVALPDTVGLMHHRDRPGYSAWANFELREDPTAKGAGHCTGRAALDFQVDDHHRAYEAEFDGMDLGAGNPTLGCGQLFRGTWQDNRTGQRKAVAWANSFEVIVPDALQKMGLGQRGADFDPRLARYGWNTLMENTEWWHDAPTPKPLSL